MIDKKTKYFYYIDGLNYDTILNTHKEVKDIDDGKRIVRGAKVGRPRTKEPFDPDERQRLKEYRDTTVEDDTPFNCIIYEIPSDKPATIKKSSTDKTLIRKYEFFLYNLISRQISSDDGIAYLSSLTLQAIFDKEYKLMIDTLCRLQIIATDGFHKVGEKATGYWITSKYKDRIKYRVVPIYYPYKPYVERLNSILVKGNIPESKGTPQKKSDGFLSVYYNNLQQLTLSHPVEAEKFILQYLSPYSNRQLYYLNTIQQYIHHLITRPIVPNLQDNRIYHILTSTPRYLKYFLNIKYSVDIHNSHPLLFSSILYDTYNVPLSIRQTLTSIIINTPLYNTHNIRVKLCNKLKESGIDYPKIKDIPLDVIRYVHLTSTGQFWDKVLTRPQPEVLNNNGYALLRQDIKVIMFAQVFYGKKLSSRGQAYAKVFKKKFPNVYSVVLSFKREKKYDERTVLTHKLMALESRLFREALQRLFDMGFKVVSIHDAIVVLDVKGNEPCTPELVKKVLIDVYGENGLIPDCSMDYYGENEMKKLMDKTTFLREEGEKYIAQLRDEAPNDEDIKRMVDDYDRGKSEIILTPDGKGVMLHLRDVKDLLYG